MLEAAWANGASDAMTIRGLTAHCPHSNDFRARQLIHCGPG